MKYQVCDACGFAATAPLGLPEAVCPLCSGGGTVAVLDEVEELPGANVEVRVRWSLLFRMTVFITTSLQCIQKGQASSGEEILSVVGAGREVLSEMQAVSAIERAR